MKKQSLRNTNPHLKDPVKQRELIAVSISSSSAIEGIQISASQILEWQKQTFIPPYPEPHSA